MERIRIRELFRATPADGETVTVRGWAKTVRGAKSSGLIELSHGSCFFFLG